jgi:hypothetical protein
MDNLTYEARLGLALEDLSKQARPNPTGTARTYNVNHTTLQRRFYSLQQDRASARAETNSCLYIAQEETLIGYINSLTDHSLPPTSQIVHNIAEELVNRTINKNWVSDFVKQHKDRLHSVYLRTIKNNRVKADSIPSLESFYNLVCLYITYI